MDTFPSVHSIDSARRASRRATRSTPRSAEGRSRSESNAADTPPPEADATSVHPPAVFSDVVMNRTSARAPNRARAGGAGRVAVLMCHQDGGFDTDGLAFGEHWWYKQRSALLFAE